MMEKNETQACLINSTQAFEGGKVGDDEKNEAPDKNEPNGDEFIKQTSMPTVNGLLEDLPDEWRDNEYLKTGYRLNIIGFRNVFMTAF